MRGAGHELRVRHRRRMYAGGDETRNVSDIHHHQGAGFFGYTRDALEIDHPWIRACAHDDQLRFVLAGKAGELFVIDQLRILMDSVWHDAIVLSGEVKRMTVREMP